MLDHVTADAQASPLDVGWSLVSTRAVFEHPAVVVGRERGALATGLAGRASGRPEAAPVVGRARAPAQPALVVPC
ncbi:hypothetical protein [Mycobacterium avium]|uniref:hypothetical protein n=1 Tax=Mycobacterium avium TaxID=1764 RepID=UPI0039BDBFA9